jgi:hypothetical protein
MIVRDEIEGHYVCIKCDQCSRTSPPAKELLEGHGLVNMGWYCSGGIHLCPDHSDEAST